MSAPNTTAAAKVAAADVARVAVAVVEAGAFVGVQFFASEEAARSFLFSFASLRSAFPSREPTARGDG